MQFITGKQASSMLLTYYLNLHFPFSGPCLIKIDKINMAEFSEIKVSVNNYN